MNKKNKNKLIVIAIGILICFWIYVSEFTKFNYRNILPHTQLPEKYKLYKELTPNNNSIFEIYNLEHTATYYDSIQNILICEEENRDDYSTTFYKMNKDGAIFDSLKIKENIDYEYHYLLQHDYYYDWIITGNTDKKKYLEIDNSKIITSSILDSVVQNYHKKATATHIYYGYQLNDKNINRYLFLIKLKWYALNVADNLDKTYSLSSHYVIDNYNRIRIREYKIGSDSIAVPDVYTSIPGCEKAYNSATKIKYYVDYFDKDKYSSSVSGTMNNDHGAFWSGTAYIHYVSGKDTLKFKDEDVLLMEETDWGSWEKYENTSRIYANDRLNFVLIDKRKMIKQK